MLSLKHWQNQRAEFEAAGVRLPAFDVEKAKAAGAAQPRLIHIGGGNLFRTFHADMAQQLLDKGLLDEGSSSTCATPMPSRRSGVPSTTMCTRS